MLLGLRKSFSLKLRECLSLSKDLVEDVVEKPSSEVYTSTGVLCPDALADPMDAVFTGAGFLEKFNMMATSRANGFDYADPLLTSYQWMARAILQ